MWLMQIHMGIHDEKKARIPDLVLWRETFLGELSSVEWEQNKRADLFTVG